jgi:hypothetical protein
VDVGSRAGPRGRTDTSAESQPKLGLSACHSVGTLGQMPDSHARAQQRAARDRTGRYHQEQLELLLEHVREDFAQMDAGYDRRVRPRPPLQALSAEALILLRPDRPPHLTAARTLDFQQDHGEDARDWWAAGEAGRCR